MSATSIFARDLTHHFPVNPRERIAREIHHLRHVGRSRWRTNPFIASLRLISGLVFLGVLGLYFLDPVLFSIHKTRAVNASIYLTRWGNPADVRALRQSGMFTPRDLKLLDQRAQAPGSEEVKRNFSGTAEARRAADGAVYYMGQVKALHSGDLRKADPLTVVRYHLFRHFGLIPPRQWISLNPVIPSE